MATEPDLLSRIAASTWGQTSLGALFVLVLSFIGFGRGRRVRAEDDAGTAKAGAEESLYDTLSKQLASFSSRLDAAERALAESLARERVLQRQVDELTLANKRMALALEEQGITQPGGLAS